MSTSSTSQPAATTASQAPLQVQTSLTNAAPRATSPSATSPARAKAAAALAASASGSGAAGSAGSQDVQAASTGAAELTTAVDALLDEMRRRYGDVSRDLLGRMDEMSRRLDALEAGMRGGGAGGGSSSSNTNTN